MAILDFDALIREFSPRAIRQLVDEADWDKKAIVAVNNIGAEHRHEILRRWLASYSVFQGMDGAQRDALSTAVLDWADRQPKDSRLDSLNALVHAHAELMAACSTADGRGRSFLSLAAKAMWLRYPEEVPIYDRFAQEALWLLSKLAPDLLTLAEMPYSAPAYAQFVQVWHTLYKRCTLPLEALDTRGYPYRVRIFDRTLWLIGEPRYAVSPSGQS